MHERSGRSAPRCFAAEGRKDLIRNPGLTLSGRSAMQFYEARLRFMRENRPRECLVDSAFS